VNAREASRPPTQINDLLPDQYRIGGRLEAWAGLRSIDKEGYDSRGRKSDSLFEELLTI
jgi:hypothetical protein